MKSILQVIGAMLVVTVWLTGAQSSSTALQTVSFDEANPSGEQSLDDALFPSTASAEEDGRQRQRQLAVTAQWELRNVNFTVSMCATPDLDVMVSFYLGYAYVSRDIGYTWDLLNAPRDAYQHCAITKDGQQVVLSAVRNAISETTDHVQLAYNGTFNFTGWSFFASDVDVRFISMSENGTYIYRFDTNYLYKSIDNGITFHKYVAHSGLIEGAACSASGQYVVYVGN